MKRIWVHISSIGAVTTAESMVEMKRGFPRVIPVDVSGRRSCAFHEVLQTNYLYDLDKYISQRHSLDHIAGSPSVYDL